MHISSINRHTAGDSLNHSWHHHQPYILSISRINCMHDHFWRIPVYQMKNMTCSSNAINGYHGLQFACITMSEVTVLPYLTSVLSGMYVQLPVGTYYCCDWVIIIQSYKRSTQRATIHLLRYLKHKKHYWDKEQGQKRMSDKFVKSTEKGADDSKPSHEISISYETISKNKTKTNCFQTCTNLTWIIENVVSQWKRLLVGEEEQRPSIYRVSTQIIK